MPSPFPGMDPYLEGEMWEEFHAALANAISAQLMPQIAPKYVALLAKRQVIERLSSHPPGMSVPQVSIEVRDIAQRRHVTLIEILIAANKHGEGVRDYAARRKELLSTHSHLLEIDLLRDGTRIPLTDPLPEAPYYVYLSRAQNRPFTTVWAIRLQDRMPVVPVPLLPPDPDVPLDLQAAVDACFELVGYERLLDYRSPLPSPALADEDAAWLAAILREAGHAP
jgi:hypothetical protein